MKFLSSPLPSLQSDRTILHSPTLHHEAHPGGFPKCLVVLDSSDLAPLSWDALSGLVSQMVSKWRHLALLLKIMDITVLTYLNNLSALCDAWQGKYKSLNSAEQV